MAIDHVALIQRRQRELAKLRTATAAGLARLWRSLDSYDEGTQSRWRQLAGPLVAAGQGKALDLQLAYLRVVLDGAITFERQALLAGAKVELDEPFLALARALKAGRGLEAAIEAGRLRAEGLGESAVQWASRAANEAVEGDERIVGWTRTLTGLACSWCRDVARQRYRTAESASFGHQRCDCGVDPIIGDSDPGRTVNERLSA